MYGINLNPTLGAAFIGILCATAFYGITALQTIYYFMTYPKDKLHLKFLVFILWILDTVSLALVAHGVYALLVLDFGDFLALEYVVWSIAAEPMVSATIALIVHLFLVYRIWTLNRSWWKYAISLVLFSIAPFIVAVLFIAHIFRNDKGLLWSNAAPRWMEIVADTLTSAVDLVIACTICIQLYAGRTGFSKTNAIINILIIYTINSGLLPTIVSFAEMITSLAWPQNLVFEVFNMTISKAYVNTLLATLNSRNITRELSEKTTIGTMAFAAVDFGSSAVASSLDRSSGNFDSVPRVASKAQVPTYELSAVSTRAVSGDQDKRIV